MNDRIRRALRGSAAITAALSLATGASTAAAAASTTSNHTTSKHATSNHTTPKHTMSSSRTLAPDTRFFVPPPPQAAIAQELTLLRDRHLAEALRLARMLATPQAVWFTSGTPAQVKQQVHQTIIEAQRQRAVPVLVAYDVPGRDCAQFSAGGALTDADYQAWIAAFAAGIGQAKAVVIVEPDALGNMPSDCGIPAGTSFPFTDQGRITDVADAVADLEADPNTSVYLDGTHSAWQQVGNIAQRLVEAGVQQAQGFYLDVSNYQYTSNNIAYGTWISDCIAFAQGSGAIGTGAVQPGVYQPETGFFNNSCPNQFWNGGPATNFIGTAMDNFVPWNDQTPPASDLPDPDTVVGINGQYANDLASVGATASTHFVIDTSRNGEGANPMTGGADADMPNFEAAPFDQPASVISTLRAGNWCNPVGSGNGVRPSGDTGVPLVDAYLWVKIPGESDGQCDSAAGVRAWDFSAYNPWNVPPSAQGTFDPLWGQVDPAAGAWFGVQALQLTADANQSPSAPGNAAPAP
jgi:endoglucanase